MRLKERRLALTTNLEVDQTDGITWTSSDQQDMFFRKGEATAGEDTTRWFLFEWRDLESRTGSSPMGRPVPVLPSTWGKIKTLYAL